MFPSNPTEISIIPASEISFDLEAEEVSLEDYMTSQEPQYSSLASHIISSFNTNRDAKRSAGVEDEIFASLRDYNGKYSPDDLVKIEQEGGSKIFMNLTATKSRAAMSWIRDILLSANEDAFSIKSTPIPSLPEDLEAQLEAAFAEELKSKTEEIQSSNQGRVSPKAAQDTILTLAKDKRDIRDSVIDQINLEALDEMKFMERKIKDDLKEGEWDKALSDFIEDFCIFPTAFLKGPIVTRKEKLTWDRGIPVVTDKFCFLNKRVSPIDIYPSPMAETVYDGDLIEHMRLTAKELYNLKEVPGYKEESIDKILEENLDGSSWLNTGIDSERAEEENKDDSLSGGDGIFHALHFWGTAKTSDIKEWGLLVEEDEDDENKQWEIEAILVGTEVIKCKLNDDPLKRRPYYKASYQNTPGSFWGRSLPNLMRDIQRMCNACARALANNMGLSAGPQIELYIDRLADNGDIEDIKPLKIWQVTNDPTGASGRAINFFQVPSIANELLAVYEKFEQKADDATGIPRYSYGNEKVGGAAQTASGLSMLLESATKSIKDAIRHIDSGLIIPRVEYQFYWNLIKSDFKYSGDIEVVAHGSNTLTLKGAQQAKRQEFLQITANETDQGIMGPEGRAELIRQLSKDLGLTADIVPSRLELRKKTEMMQQQQEQMAQIRQQEIQGKQSASLEATRMQVEGQMLMNREAQATRREEIAQRAQDNQVRNQIEVAKLEGQKESTQVRALTASEGNQTKREIARTQASVALVKDGLNT